MTLESFFGKYNGQSLLWAPSSAREYLRGQCVQLACYYVNDVWGKPVIWDDAYGWFTDGRLSEHYIRIPNDHNDPTQIPPHGALIVWGAGLPNSGNAGHISICWDARPSQATFISFDSNWGGKTAHLVTHNWSYVVGWIIPRGLATQTPVPQGGQEMITTPDEASKIYKLLRPNSGASQGEIDNTVGKRSFHNFLNDAQAEVNARDANLAKQAQEFAIMQSNINQLNSTITELRTSLTTDTTIRAEEQHAAQEKISYLTGQLESSHDKITQLQAVNIPAQAAQTKPNWLTGLIVALLPKKKK